MVITVPDPNEPNQESINDIVFGQFIILSGEPHQSIELQLPVV